MYGIVYIYSFVVSADSVNWFKNRYDNSTFGRIRILSMNIKQIFTEPETEVNWYFDSIEEIVMVYISETGLEALLLAPITLYVYV